MTQRHTPGPWEAIEVGTTSAGPDAELVFEVCSERRRICEFVDGRDANLIAAAPELLDALKLCAAVCAGEVMSKNGLVNALEAARKAIAKATGEAA